MRAARSALRSRTRAGYGYSTKLAALLAAVIAGSIGVRPGNMIGWAGMALSIAALVM